VPEDSLRLVKDAWAGLSAQHLQEQTKQAKSPLEDRNQPYRQIQLQILERRLEAARLRLKDTALETNTRSGLEEVVTNLTKQILDLQSCLHEL
jgi:hypothetical protein